MASTAHLFRSGNDSGDEPRIARSDASVGPEVEEAGAEVIAGPWGHAAAVPPPGEDDRPDHFVTRDGKTFAGTHLIVDLWGASRLDDLVHVERTLKQAVEAAGATLLHIHLHHFTPNGGVSGVAVLAESHISIHTWPERAYAALDVFMCGDARPHAAVPVLEDAFRPERTVVDTLTRGEVAAPPAGAATP